MRLNESEYKTAQHGIKDKIKEFAAVISRANLTLNDQEWRRFMAEGRRLKNESQQMENIR
jgi:hypothetical protein